MYILRSKACSRYYIGQTQNKESRLLFHNSSKARWTKRFQPWDMVYSEEFATRSEAVKREGELKRLKDIKKFLINSKLLISSPGKNSGNRC